MIEIAHVGAGQLQLEVSAAKGKWISQRTHEADMRGAIGELEINRVGVLRVLQRKKCTAVDAKGSYAGQPVTGQLVGAAAGTATNSRRLTTRRATRPPVLLGLRLAGPCRALSAGLSERPFMAPLYQYSPSRLASTHRAFGGSVAQKQGGPASESRKAAVSWAPLLADLLLDREALVGCCALDIVVCGWWRVSLVDQMINGGFFAPMPP
jgi:hypothetical protein